MVRKNRRKQLQRNLNDCVIYWSRRDDCWIAHSLHTDQLGHGAGPLYALADMLKAVQDVMALAAEDETIQPWREAPRRVQKMCEVADPLPKEIFEVAYKMVHGDWPKSLQIQVECGSRRRKLVVKEMVEPTPT